MPFRATNFVIIKLTFYFIIGILLSKCVTLSFYQSLIVVISLIAMLIIAMLATRSSFKPLSWLDVLLYLTIISVGYLTAQCHNPKHFKHHYIQQQQFDKDSIYTVQFRISKVLKPSNFYTKYIVILLQKDHSNTTGKLLLNIPKDSLARPPNVDDIYIARTSFSDVPSARNPYQFDYGKYLNKLHIYHQITLDSNQLLLMDSSLHTAVGYASILRNTINKRLSQFSYSKDELAIINALLLGQRQDISKDIYESYTKAGAIHILAVSGLHIGLILLFLQFLFKPLDRIKKGTYLKVILIILLLWCYAIIAGLSPSVVRAVCMFTIFAIAMNLKRQTNVYNTIAISMFILLIFRSNFLFDVGFQMSYLAVISIVTLVPMFQKLWQPKFKILDFFWRILTVTCAAQIGVLPISLFYFHQFPGLFFVSNLVIIPCLGIILGLGIFVLILSLANHLPELLASLYSQIISTLNSFVNWVSLQEEFLFQNIPFSIMHVVISYLIIISVIVIIKTNAYKIVMSTLSLIIVLNSILLIKKFKKSDSSFIIFHKSKQTILGFRNGNSLELKHSLTDSIIGREQLLIDYETAAAIKHTAIDNIKDVYSINNKVLLIIDSLCVYNLASYKPNAILLRNSPKINLVRLIDSIQPEIIISDGSNYRSYERRWSKTCKAKKIPFHQTSEKGAFIYNF